MLCPLCQVGLLMSVREGVEIDCCPRCGGIWLDHGELFTLLNHMFGNQRSNTPSLKPRSKIVQNSKMQP